MAGLGRKVFNSGDILLASEVQGFLQDQSVMVFDDDAARTAAIATPTEGMVTFRKDDNALEVFDGSTFVAVGGGSEPGLVHIDTTTFSASSAESFNDVFTSSFKFYKVIVQVVGSTGTNCNLRFRTSASDNSTSNYQLQRTSSFGGTTSSQRVSNASLYRIEDVSTANTFFTLEISNPQQAIATGVLHTFVVGFAGTGPFTQDGGGGFNGVTSFDGFSIFPNAGTITGTISVFAYKE